MGFDKDFTRVQVKIKVAGSWANLVYCSVDHYDEVKLTCEQLAKIHQGSINFKIVDADGGTIEQYTPKPPNGKREWHEPRVSRSQP